LAISGVLLDGKINKDLLDWLALEARHPEPAEVNIPGLLSKPSLVTGNCPTYQ
jgi:hypothetical protein